MDAGCMFKLKSIEIVQELGALLVVHLSVPSSYLISDDDAFTVSPVFIDTSLNEILLPVLKVKPGSPLSPP